MMTDQQYQEHDEPSLGKTIKEDLRRGDFFFTLRRDFEDLQEFYLTDERRNHLREMNALKRFIVMAWWIFRSMVLKLTPARRIALLLGSVLLLISYNQGIENPEWFFIIGFVILLFVVMLELKDKLLAQSELRAGRAVQNALMPDHSPMIPGWDVWLFTQPANEVGGDLIDFFHIEANRYGIALGDIAGKGLGAALFMVKLQATLRALLPDITRLDDLGSRLNKIFCRDSKSKSFASLVYLELHPELNTIRFLNAGHLPPVQMHARLITKTPKGSIALGIMENAAYTEESIELQQGDTFVIYSDGVTEASSDKKEFFGEERLMNMMPSLQDQTARDAGERILSHVNLFVGDAKVHDDLSLVVIKRIT